MRHFCLPSQGGGPDPLFVTPRQMAPERELFTGFCPHSVTAVSVWGSC
jgi:hypothetical protein